MSKIRANFISSKNDNRAVEFTKGIVVGGAITATNFDFNANTFNGEQFNVGTGASIYQESSNQLKFGIGNQEAVVIRGDESVDIGGTPPWTTTGSGYRNLSISGSTQSSAAFVWLGNGAATGNNGFDLTRINIMNGPTIVSQIVGTTADSNNDSGKIVFNTKTTGSSLAEAATFTDSGNLAFPSGQGIDFGATGEGSGTMTREVLDDYEEGYFAPTLTMSTSGSVTLQALYTDLSYVKIGSLVTIIGQIRLNTVSSPVGNISITNLPFTVRPNTDLGRAGTAMYYYDASGGAANYTKVFPMKVSENTSTMDVLIKDTGGGMTPGNGDELAFSFSYITNS